MEVSYQLQASVALPPWKESLQSLSKMLLGPEVQTLVLAKRNFCAPFGN
jgi:hypothetical protein